MSKKQNDEYIEGAKEKFDELVSMGDWLGVNELYVKLEGDDMSQIAIELSRTLTKDEMETFKKWDLETNGTTADKMDDNS